MNSMKTYQDVEVMLPSKWAAKFRPKAFRPAVVGDWVFLPTVDHVIKLTADHTGSLGACHLILEPIAPDPKEWWPKWLKARWLFGKRYNTNQWTWYVGNDEEGPTPKLPLGEWLRPSLFDLSFIPDVESKEVCFRNPWLDEHVRQINAGVAYERTENAS